MECGKKLVLAILVSLVGSIIGGADVKGSPPCSFPAIYNFGDSNSDTGGYSAALGPSRLPDGETFFGKPTGRASDGRLIIDFMVEQLGLPYLSSYLDSLGSNYSHGANFAVGGATIRRLNNHPTPFYLGIQTTQYDQFKARIKEVLSYDHQARPQADSRDLNTSRRLFTPLTLARMMLCSGVVDERPRQREVEVIDRLVEDERQQQDASEIAWGKKERSIRAQKTVIGRRSSSVTGLVGIVELAFGGENEGLELSLKPHSVGFGHHFL